jgi:hypothetical protein
VRSRDRGALECWNQQSASHICADVKFRVRYCCQAKPAGTRANCRGLDRDVKVSDAASGDDGAGRSLHTGAGQGVGARTSSRADKIVQHSVLAWPRQLSRLVHNGLHLLHARCLVQSPPCAPQRLQLVLHNFGSVRSHSWHTSFVPQQLVQHRHVGLARNEATPDTVSAGRGHRDEGDRAHCCGAQGGVEKGRGGGTCCTVEHTQSCLSRSVSRYHRPLWHSFPQPWRARWPL